MKRLFLGLLLVLFITANFADNSFLKINSSEKKCAANEIQCWEFCCEAATNKCCVGWTYPSECRSKGTTCVELPPDN